MSKDSATVIKDGQLAVATVPQTGTLVGAASEIDATALVETADGLQLCVKTCEVGGGKIPMARLPIVQCPKLNMMRLCRVAR